MAEKKYLFADTIFLGGKNKGKNTETRRKAL